LKIRFGAWDEPLRYEVSQFGKSDGTVEGQSDLDLIEISSTPSANGTSIEKAVNAHEIGVLVACLKKERMKQYNDEGLQSAPDDNIRYFTSFDMNSKYKSLVRSPINPHLDNRLEIPSQLILALGCPVRNLRAVEAFSGDTSIIIPKNSFGTFQYEIFDEADPTKSTARVQFQIGKKFWVSNVKFTVEEFNLSELDTTNEFKPFFENFSHRLFMPLEVAYSVTMTSLQGREFNNLIFDLHDVGTWIRHVLYMGLTRVRSSKGIRCLNIPPTESPFNKNDHEILLLFSKLEEMSKQQMSSESNRNESLLTMDFVDLLEKFKVFYILFFFF